MVRSISAAKGLYREPQKQKAEPRIVRERLLSTVPQKGWVPGTPLAELFQQRYMALGRRKWKGMAGRAHPFLAIAVLKIL